MYYFAGSCSCLVSFIWTVFSAKVGEGIPYFLVLFPKDCEPNSFTPYFSVSPGHFVFVHFPEELVVGNAEALS